MGKMKTAPLVPKAESQEASGHAARARHSFADRFQSDATAWVVLVVSLVITAFSWWLASDYVAERARDRFDFEVHQARQAIFKRMQEYEQVLRGGVGLFQSSAKVSRQEWHDYVANLQINTYWPGIQGIGYSVMLVPGELDTFIQSVRKEGFLEFTVKPEGPRERYSSILYLEPFDERNRRAFGYDMYSQKTRRAAMAQSQDSGLPAVSSTRAQCRLYQTAFGGLQVTSLVSGNGAVTRFPRKSFNNLAGHRNPDAGRGSGSSLQHGLDLSDVLPQFQQGASQQADIQRNGGLIRQGHRQIGRPIVLRASADLCG